MKSEEFELEVVTPMFISGADPTKNELRAPTFKGLLRWWWRALNGNLPIVDLKEREEDIFGSTNRRSSFSIQVDANNSIKTAKENLPPGPRIQVTSKGRTFSISLIDYLAFGIAEYDKVKKENVYNRPHIKVGSEFKVQLFFYRDEVVDDVLNAMQALIKYGALGSKSRNGFGCLKSTKPLSLQITPPTTLASYPAFSRETRLFGFNKHNTWENALAEIGKFYREARLNLEDRHVFDKRLLVAKPIEVKGEISVRDRHSKTFFLHIEKKEKQFQGRILNLPYEYYQNNDRDEYFSVNKKMCDYLGKNAQEVINAF
jgi:CRISPR-associated protein Cmr1